MIPSEFGVAVLAVALLGEDRVLGPGGLDPLDDRGLAGAVDLGHEIDRGALRVDRESSLVSLALDRGRAACDLTGEFEDRGEGGVAGDEGHRCLRVWEGASGK